MARKNQNQNAAKMIQQKKSSSQQKKSGNRQRQPQQQLVRAPQNLSIRSVTPASGEIRTEMILEVKKGLTTFVLHPDNIHWLRQVCPSFQQWGLSNVKMWYEPRVSTATNGQVAMSFLSDFADDIRRIDSLDGLTRVGGSSRGAPWDKFNLNVPRYRLFQYANMTAFSAMESTDKNTRAMGTLAAYADMDDSFPSGSVVGRIYLQYVPVLRGATDPTTQTG